MADKYCRDCGHELEQEDRFCPGCGQAAHQAARVPTSEADMSVPPTPQPADEGPRTPVGGANRGSGFTVTDVLIVVIFFPVWMLLVATAMAVGNASSGYELGYMAADGVFDHFFLYAAIAALLTFFTVRWSRWQRRKRRHEAEVREAQEQFFLDAARSRWREDE